MMLDSYDDLDPYAAPRNPADFAPRRRLKVVPEEATEEMMLAGWRAQFLSKGATEAEADTLAKKWLDDPAQVVLLKSGWAAALAASPEPPPGGWRDISTAASALLAHVSQIAFNSYSEPIGDGERAFTDEMWKQAAPHEFSLVAALRSALAASSPVLPGSTKGGEA